MTISLLVIFSIILIGRSILSPSSSSSSNNQGGLRSKFHDLVSKYELTGYGASHPRAAFTIVATQDLSDPVDSVAKAISSILSTTDRNRILVICAVFQQGVLSVEEQTSVETLLRNLDAGTSPHWHGTTLHTHPAADTTTADTNADTNADGTDTNADANNKHSHGHKIKTIFLDTASVAESRRDAANYIHLLIANHEDANLKSKDENIISVLLRPDSVLETEHWIDTVTHGLLGTSSASSSSNTNADNDKTTANAISFAASSTETISEGETKSINLELKPIKSHASSDALLLTQGQSYPTPIVEGAATALLLSTFRNLPVGDRGLDSHFASDLELSFNLWMCADGIDIVDSIRAKTTLGLLQHKDKAGMSDVSVVRLAMSWMMGGTGAGKGDTAGNQIGKHVLEIVSEGGGVSVQNLEKDGKLTGLPDPGLLKMCRSFEWFTKNVNVAMDKELAKLEPIGAKFEQQVVAVKKSNGNASVDTVGNDNQAPLGELPTKPLSALNKRLISTAKMVDLPYVDAADGHIKDPHRGAMDEHDQFGYVHDEKALRANPPPFKFTKQQVQCDKKDGTMTMLTEKVFVDFAGHEAAEKRAETSGKPRAKIFCLVYTIEKFHDRIAPIRESWGQKCDGFMVGSTKTDVELGTVNIPHEGEEEYNNIWQKVRAMWSYIYDNYYEEYDWFHIGGDDLYLLVENLRLYLESEEIQLASNGGERLPTGKEGKQLPLFLGRRFKEQGNEKRIFNSGGSGYTMNKAALKALVADAFPTCQPHLHTFAEDVMVAQCFRNKLEVFPFDTKDENGGERYMPFAPMHHLNYNIPKDVKSDWYANYSIDIKEGLDHCAARSVAFHYIKGDMMKRMHAILYGHCA